MHVFQPLPINEIDINPFDLIGNQWGLVTASNGKKVDTMTVSWGAMGRLWNRNTATIYLRQSRYTKELLDGADAFSLSFFDPSFKSALKYLGSVSGRDEDKIKNARMHVNLYKEVPFIDEANFVVICKKLFAQELPMDALMDPAAGIEKDFYAEGDFHTMYIGEILELMAR